MRHGLRPGLIAFTEILLNFTSTAHTTDQIVNGAKFQSILKMQKYLEGPQLFYIAKVEKKIEENLDSYGQLEVTLLIMELLLTIIAVLVVWKPLMQNLSDKILSTSQILGLIPIRIFIKNSKLAK